MDAEIFLLTNRKYNLTFQPDETGISNAWFIEIKIKHIIINFMFPLSSGFVNPGLQISPNLDKGHHHEWSDETYCLWDEYGKLI